MKCYNDNKKNKNLLQQKQKDAVKRTLKAKNLLKSIKKHDFDETKHICSVENMLT